MRLGGGPYLKLKNIVDLVEFLLIPIYEDHKSAVQLSKACRSSMAVVHPPSQHFSVHISASSPERVLPGGKLLKGLLSMCVALPGNRLREGTLGGPGDGGSSGHWDSRAHSADLRRGAHEGHFWRQLGS